MWNDCLAVYVAMVEKKCSLSSTFWPPNPVSQGNPFTPDIKCDANGTETGTIDDNSDSQKLLLKRIIQTSKVGSGSILGSGYFDQSARTQILV